jgi:hypothetical protein
MTPRTLWTIILKIFGLYVLIQALYIVLQLFVLLIGLAGQQNTTLWQALAYVLFSVGLYLMVVYISLFKTDLVINKLKLDTAIEEEKIEINIHRSSILTIVILLSGILMFADSAPTLLKELYSYFAVINDYVHFKNYPRAGMIIVEFLKTAFAIFMMTSSRLIVNFIERKRRKVALAAKEAAGIE